MNTRTIILPAALAAGLVAGLPRPAPSQTAPAPAGVPADIVLSTGESDDAAVWKGAQRSDKQAKAGKGSILWSDLAKNPVLTLDTTPADWSKHQTLHFWMYSEKANGQGLQLVIPSENPASDGIDYYSVGLKVNWTGWKSVDLPLDGIPGTRTPLGWDKAGKLYLSSNGWDHTPLADTVLYIDDVRLVADPTAYATTLLNPALADTDGDGTPEQWRIQPPANGTTTFAKSEKAPEGSFVRLTDKDAAVGIGLSQTVRGRADRQYAFTASTRGSSAWLYLKFYDKDRKPVGTEVRAATAESKEWKSATVTAPSPPKTHWVEVWVYTTSIGQGEIDVSKPELKDIGAAEKPAVPIPDEKAFFEKLNLDYPGMDAVKAAVAKADWTAAKSAYLQFRRTRSKARWTVDPSQMPATATAATDEAADKVVKHIYSFPYSSGSTEVNMGPKIDWNANPIPPTDPSFSKEWTYITLNRMHQWETLGRAYWKTRDEKYAREWVSLLTDWVESNPVPLEAGPGSTLTWRTIETGIRQSGSWPSAYYYFLNSPSFTPDAHFLYAKSALEHAYRLRIVEKNFPNHGGNWVTMEMNGLGTVGLLFPEFKESKAFLDVAFGRMSKELTAQVYPDGAQIELSTGYHQVSLGNFMTLAKTAKLNEYDIPGDYLAKLKSMYVYNLWLMDQNGVLPPLNDSGPTNVRGSLTEAADLWGDPAFQWGATRGREGKAIPTSHFFPYAGYAVLRGGWRPADTYMAFDAGPIGSGHWHEDMLSVYVRAFGRTLLTDPGNFMYDKSKWRRYILSTPAHNTIVVDGKEQYRGRIAGQLQQEPLKNPRLLSPVLDYVAGTYDQGYQATEYADREYQPFRYVGTLDTSISHTRHILFLKPYAYVAVDFLTGTGTHRYDAHFHMDAPDAVADPATGAVVSKREDGIQIGLFPMDPAGLSTKIVKGQEEPVLGWIPNEKRPIPTVVYTKTGPAPTTFSTLLYPYNTVAAPKVSFEPLLPERSDVWARSVTTPHEQAALLIRRASGAPVTFGAPLGMAVTTDAQAAALRRPTGTAPAPGQTAIHAAFQGATRIETPQIALTSAAPVSLAIASVDGKTLVFNAGDAPAAVSLTRPAARAATFAPQSWTEVSAAGDKPAAEPAPLFAVVSEVASKAPTYVAYAEANHARAKSPGGVPITIQAESMTLAPGIRRAPRVATEGDAIYMWDAPGQAIEATVTVPADGLYRIESRYAAQMETSRQLTVDGQVPFREAADIVFLPTVGAPPSDGWSNKTDDWRVLPLGAPAEKSGWSVYLTRGAHKIRLSNELGGGLNLDWLRVVPG